MALFVLSRELMLGRMLLSLGLAAVVFIVPLRAPAQSCILSNTASQEDCQPASCQNQTCCATAAEHRTGPSVPVAKNDPGQSLPAACAPAVYQISLVRVPPVEPFLHLAISSRVNAPPRFALLCTFLI